MGRIKLLTISMAILTVIVALLAALGYQGYRLLNANAETGRGEDKNYLRTLVLDQLFSAMKDVEAGQRLFILTGDGECLKPLAITLNQVDQKLASLRRLAQDDPEAKESIEGIGPLVWQKLAELQETIELRQTKGLEAALQVLTTEHSRGLMDELRRRVALAQMQEADGASKDQANPLGDVMIIQDPSEPEKKSPTRWAAMAGLGLALIAGYFLSRRLSRRPPGQGAARAAAPRAMPPALDKNAPPAADKAAQGEDAPDFSTVLARDLKTPLRIAAAEASWLAEDYADSLGSGGRFRLNNIVERLQRIDRATGAMLRYWRLGQAEPKRESVAVGEVVQDAIRELAPPSTVHIRVASDLPVIAGDPGRLHQVFQSLLGHALPRHGHAETDIEVSCRREDAHWKFAVSINGPSHPIADTDRTLKVLQPFNTQEDSLSANFDLACAKRIVEQAGGWMWVESRPEVGTIYYFTWPDLPNTVALPTQEKMAA